MYYGFKTAASGTHRCSFRATNNMIRTKNKLIVLNSLAILKTLKKCLIVILNKNCNTK